MLHSKIPSPPTLAPHLLLFRSRYCSSGQTSELTCRPPTAVKAWPNNGRDERER